MVDRELVSSGGCNNIAVMVGEPTLFTNCIFRVDISALPLYTVLAGVIVMSRVSVPVTSDIEL